VERLDFPLLLYRPPRRSSSAHRIGRGIIAQAGEKRGGDNRELPTQKQCGNGACPYATRHEASTFTKSKEMFLNLTALK